MKKLREIVAKPLDELTAFQDPPTVLILRRKGIRLFPNNQRVASYRNDNLDLEVAIPYNPETLGQHKISTVGSNIGEETLDEEKKYSPEELKIRRDRRTLHADVQRNQYAVWNHESKAKSQFTDPKSRKKHIQAIAGARMKHEWSVKALIDHQEKHGPLSGIDHHMEETLDEEGTTRIAHHRTDSGDKWELHASEPNQYSGRVTHSIKLTAREGKDLPHKSTWKSGEPKYIKKHWDKIVSESVYNPAAVDKAIKASKPKIGSKERSAIHRLLKGRHGDPTQHGPKEHAVSKPMKALLTGEETSVDPSEVVLEATIHSLHSIARSKTPATVRFKNGASAMVHHGTAARVMRLHSLMRKHNKRKVEGLVNSSPDGLKKVVDFVDTHLK